MFDIVLRTEKLTVPGVCEFQGVKAIQRTLTDGQPQSRTIKIQWRETPKHNHIQIC